MGLLVAGDFCRSPDLGAKLLLLSGQKARLAAGARLPQKQCDECFGSSMEPKPCSITQSKVLDLLWEPRPRGEALLSSGQKARLRREVAPPTKQKRHGCCPL